MENMMNSFVLTGINQMELIRVPKPEIKEAGQVLIKMAAVGVCGSDIHYFTDGKIGSQVVKYPFPVGHEGAGIIEEVGEGVENLKRGDRVAIDPAMPCFECDQCKSGRFHTCRHLKFLGCPGQADGCLSEYIVMPESSCFRIEDWVSFEATALPSGAAAASAVRAALCLMKSRRCMCAFIQFSRFSRQDFFWRSDSSFSRSTPGHSDSPLKPHDDF
jgi:L-iditol 2-dehydrogenase